MNKTHSSLRKGAVTPLFALTLPVLIVMCGFAINLAYMQLSATELKISTDAAAHAGGRAMSIEQKTAPAVELAQEIASLNLVGGQPLALTTTDDDADIQFGASTRTGTSRYSFSRYDQDEVDSGARKATSFAVYGNMNLPLLFTAMPDSLTRFDTSRRSVATQVDRDIALVIDRSGSMLYYENETALSAALLQLHEQGVQVETSPATDPQEVYAFYKKKKNGKFEDFKGYYTIGQGSSNGWVYDPNDHYTQAGQPAQYETQYLIDEDEYDDATRFLYDRRYSSNVITQLATINAEMSEYAADWQTMIGSSSSWSSRTPAPRHSRWAFLVDGVDAFLQVLEGTDQEERVALITFNSSAYMGLTLQTTYSGIRSHVGGIVPYSGTGIGDGMLLGHPEIVSGNLARPFAAKTIVVLTDGDNNNGETTPQSAATTIVNQDAVTIHALTFATDAQSAKDAMETTAENGNGRYYHAETGAELIVRFREIANNLPTILTE